jgi:hypothetical protein
MKLRKFIPLLRFALVTLISVVKMHRGKPYRPLHKHGAALLTKRGAGTAEAVSAGRKSGAGCR